jgi:transposase InsO family protein
MSQREEFIALAMQGGANISALCRQFGISRRTGYKWLNRFRESGGDRACLDDRSRRPHHSPEKTPLEMERLVLDVRAEHPAWGGRKIRAYLRQHGHSDVPAASTITTILQRNKRIDPREAAKHHAYQSFEMAGPNQLWQMDFKGYFLLENGKRCHPLVVLDDHSRFLLGLGACKNEQRVTVQPFVTELFRRYGLPDRMLMDNGNPWGNSMPGRWTRFTIWLLRLDIAVSHGTPYHPQTQGKSERLHRTLQAEILSRQTLADHDACQGVFDTWRLMYNTERPHEACSLAPPETSYHLSPRSFPETLPDIEYDRGETVRKVTQSGHVRFKGGVYRIGKALARQTVAVRPDEKDGVFSIFLGKHRVAKISLVDDNQEAV